MVCGGQRQPGLVMVLVDMDWLVVMMVVGRGSQEGIEAWHGRGYVAVARRLARLVQAPLKHYL